MNRKDLLTWLGCSGSLALTLLAPHPAQAKPTPLREIVFVAPGAALAIANRGPDNLEYPDILGNLECTCSQGDAGFDLNLSDEVGERAIAQMGCDCAGCRYMVSQVSQPERMLPQ